MVFQLGTGFLLRGKGRSRGRDGRKGERGSGKEHREGEGQETSVRAGGKGGAHPRGVRRPRLRDLRRAGCLARGDRRGYVARQAVPDGDRARGSVGCLAGVRPRAEAGRQFGTKGSSSGVRVGVGSPSAANSREGGARDKVGEVKIPNCVVCAGATMLSALFYL